MTKFCNAEFVKLIARIKTTAAPPSQIPINDNIIDIIIPVASKMVQDYCRRKMVAATYTEYFNIPDTTQTFSIFLKEQNLSNVVVKLNYSNAVWADVPAEPETNYFVDAEKGSVEFLGAVVGRPRGCQITYTGGYGLSAEDATVQDVPEDISLATAYQATFMLSRISDKEIGLRDKKAPGNLNNNPKIIASSINGLVPEARALLAPYRRLLVGQRSYAAWRN
jgi:hypothetical protein